MNLIYDLEDRTLEFSKRIIRMCKSLPRNNVNEVLTKQILRSGSSVGANYIEANEALSKKDFKHRMKISRKEVKETTYWLNLIIESNNNFENRIRPLAEESIEIRKILSSIINNSK